MPLEMLGGTRALGDIRAEVAKRLIGQDSAIDAIVPYVDIHRAGLAPKGRPAGIFLLLGPTGTGKTRTVEVLADVLHGSERKMIKIDCAEFQMEHEVAKILGSPPGYLGHRETQPIFTQQKLAGVVSDACPLSIVLLDEIEKAAPSLQRAFLGVMDKAQIRLGDNTVVDFTDCLIFMTSNLGAREMMKSLCPDIGFTGGSAGGNRLESIGTGAVRKCFSPEFINRIDCVLTYQPLTDAQMRAILDIEIDALVAHIQRNDCGFTVDVSPMAKAFLIERGTSARSGARELKRTIHKHLLRPLATEVIAGNVPRGSSVTIRCDGDRLGCDVTVPVAAVESTAVAPVVPMVVKPPNLWAH